MSEKEQFYTNPEIPEGINVTPTHPLKELLVLTSGVIGCVAIVIIILSLLAEKLAVYVPFSLEQELTSGFIDTFESNEEIQTYLQSLGDKLGTYMELPEEMSITIHYVDEDVENAFATLGGHVYMYRGLIELIPHENALAMVVAHEMAHIQHRHPIIAMGRGVVIGLLFAAISGLGSDLFVGEVVSNAGMITMLSFNRDQESQSDKTAINAVAKYYGHVSGAADLFKALIKVEEKQLMSVPLFLSTHPLSEDRINILYQYAKENGWNTDQPIQPLPEFISDIKDNYHGEH